MDNIKAGDNVLITKVLKIEDIDRDYEYIREAGALIKKGELVAFPTETVYGLGANALEGKAVEGIFRAKNRPMDNPLIVHIAEKKDIDILASDIPASAYPLMEAFWPGPLTLIFKKASHIPRETTAGLKTLAIRIPDNPIARALIREAALPIAAPSANISGSPSPTRAEHVLRDLSGRIPLILDGIIPCRVGLESTVLDLSKDRPKVLRPGMVTLDMLREIDEDISLSEGLLIPLGPDEEALSPGMKHLHYSPKAELRVYDGENPIEIAKKINRAYDDYKIRGKRVAILASHETRDLYKDKMFLSLGSRQNLKAMGANLFASLRELDNRKVDIILAEAISKEDEGLAIMDRLTRAADYKIID